MLAHIRPKGKGCPLEPLLNAVKDIHIKLYINCRSTSLVGQIATIISVRKSPSLYSNVNRGDGGKWYGNQFDGSWYE
jgi:hypothetical protein